MASVPIVQATTKFSDIAGKTQLIRYAVQQTLVVGVLQVASLNADAGDIVDAVEAMSKLKLEGSQITLPIEIDAGAFKADAVAKSTVKEQAYLVYFSAVGDSLKHTTARIYIPSPEDGVLSPGGTKVDKADAAIITLDTAIKANCYSADGRALVTDANTGVRQIA